MASALITEDRYMCTKIAVDIMMHKNSLSCNKNQTASSTPSPNALKLIGQNEITEELLHNVIRIPMEHYNKEHYNSKDC